MYPTRILAMQPTRRLMRPVPVRSQWIQISNSHLFEYRKKSIVVRVKAHCFIGLMDRVITVGRVQLTRITAHTISQRLRTLKKIPPELIPLGMISLIAVSL